MINALHLLWIVPLSAFLGLFYASLTHTSAKADKDIAKLLQDKNDTIK